MGDVVISEIMANPVGLTELPATEYVEIYNASDTAISLKNWKFVYGGTGYALPDTTLEAGQYAVLYKAGQSIYTESGSLELALSSFPTLANAGKALEITNPDGETIDFIEYSTAKPAVAFERNSDGDLYLSTDPRGGTPGAVNSPEPPPPPPVIPDTSQPGDVIITEIMANPVGLTELPATEYVEIYNASGSAISLKDWKFVYGGTGYALPDTTLESGQYAVLYKAGQSIHTESGSLELALSSFPTLANAGKALEITNSNGENIDFIEYSTAKPAVAFERNDEGDLYLSTDPRGGTPGATNSPEPPPPPPVIPDTSLAGDVIITEIMANPVGLTELPATEYVEIYNTSGSAISLKDWKFVYGGTGYALPDTTLEAGQYAVLYKAGQSIYAESGSLELALTSFPTLANAGKALEITNSNGENIDFIEYSTAKPAVAFERNSEGDLYLSTDPHGGTPGAVNSPEPPPPPPVIPDTSHAGDVIITEIMANPVGLTELPETEYIEIHNTTAESIVLSGWTLVYDTRSITLPDITLPAGAYAVLYRDGREISLGAGGIAVPVATFPSSLANTGKALEIINSKGEIIDSIEYPAAKAAIAYERGDDGSLYLSTDPRGGTPGSANSPETPPPPPVIPDTSHAGDVIITEIMANPVGLTELPETEYIEIHNTTAESIVLSGWTLVYDTRSIALPDITLPAGAYAVLYRDGREISLGAGGIAVPVATFPSSLANTGKALEIVNSNGEIIDSIEYPAAKAAIAYERADDGSLYLSTDPRGGTPGSANSPETQPPPPDDTDNPDENTDNQDETDTAQWGDLIINEIMANPVGLTELPETEYVEIYNATDSAVSLSKWLFVYDQTRVALPDTMLGAAQYAVLYRSGRDILVAESGMALPITTFPANLANTGKALNIISPSGIIIDSIAYATAKAAVSFERDSAGQLYLSTDPRGGTPGAVNSPKDVPTTKPVEMKNPDERFIVDPNELIFNEILPEPYPDGSEYIEFYNRSERTLSVSGLCVSTRKTDGTLSTRYPLASITDSIPAGGFIVITTNAEGVLNFYSTPCPEAIYELRMPILNNEASTLVLYDATDTTIIDELAYSAKWHDAAIKNTKGVSLERIRPDAPTQDAANWTSAVLSVGYGTPAYKNSQFGNDEIALFVNPPEYDHAMQTYRIHYRTDKAGYRCRIRIFSTEGVQVAEIMNNQLLGADDEIAWDGSGHGGSRLTPNVYIFLAELYHPDGQRLTVKRAFLVRP
jgi:molybdopterin biosynthesis enzyme MoaB